MDFKEWLKKRINTGKPQSPSKMKKIHNPEVPPAGIRDMRKDFSKDYPGFMSYQGDIGPYKLLGKVAKGSSS